MGLNLKTHLNEVEGLNGCLNGSDLRTSLNGKEPSEWKGNLSIRRPISTALLKTTDLSRSLPISAVRRPISTALLKTTALRRSPPLFAVRRPISTALVKTSRWGRFEGRWGRFRDSRWGRFEGRQRRPRDGQQCLRRWGDGWGLGFFRVLKPKMEAESSHQGRRWVDGWGLGRLDWQQGRNYWRQGRLYWRLRPEYWRQGRLYWRLRPIILATKAERY
ncbi:hypothetical protein E3N88_10310 [Mikania micrantha]|uniref:Uncharacterized protein n=1 Tax=Mikania micrantha TaxID=192012 RepID=A0A5N6PBE7_9ASTR|nr:hypothetical protein E3N88_10310 [Mikania micrantha]